MLNSIRKKRQLVQGETFPLSFLPVGARFRLAHDSIIATLESKSPASCRIAIDRGAKRVSFEHFDGVAGTTDSRAFTARDIKRTDWSPATPVVLLEVPCSASTSVSVASAVSG